MAIETIRITDPGDIVGLIPKIEAYVKVVNNKGVYASAFTTYLMKTVIEGGDFAQFCVALEDGEPKGFIRFNVLGLPYLSDICADAIYSWSNNPAITSSLLDEVVLFAKRHNATRIHSYFYDEAIFKHMQFILSDKINVVMEDTGAIHGIGELK